MYRVCVTARPRRRPASSARAGEARLGACAAAPTKTREGCDARAHVPRARLRQAPHLARLSERLVIRTLCAFLEPAFPAASDLHAARGRPIAGETRESRPGASPAGARGRGAAWPSASGAARIFRRAFQPRPMLRAFSTEVGPGKRKGKSARVGAAIYRRSHCAGPSQKSIRARAGLESGRAGARERSEPGVIDR